MMIKNSDFNKHSGAFGKAPGPQRGFTLVELMVGMVVCALVGVGILGAYLKISRAASEQRNLAITQMNLRGSIENMALEFRLAGYDPESAGVFGVTDVRRYSIEDENTAPVLDAAGSPAVTLVYDAFNFGPADGVLNATDTFISYRLMVESDDPGITKLARDQLSGDGGAFVTPREILAENIVAIGFAYAIDDDGNKNLDTAPGGNVIWAIDTDNDNLLDANLDANGDGLLNMDDDSNGDDRIDAMDQDPNGALGGTVPLTSIRVAYVWLLASDAKATANYANKQEYQVGDRILSAAKGDFAPNVKCRLLVRSIECRNLVTP